MIKPVEYNMTIYVGRDFDQEFTFQDSNGATINLTGYSAAAQLRPTYNSDTLLATFTTTVSGSAGTVGIYLTDTQTSGLQTENYINSKSATTSTNAVWDLVLTDTLGKKYSYIKGKVTVEGTATQ